MISRGAAEERQQSELERRLMSPLPDMSSVRQAFFAEKAHRPCKFCGELIIEVGRKGGARKYHSACAVLARARYVKNYGLSRKK